MTKQNWVKFQKFWFPLILYSGIIFYASSVPRVKTPLQEIQFDKFLHIFIYLPFGFLLARLIAHTKESVSRRMLLIIVLLGSFVYGLSDEIHQIFVPGRRFEIIDIIANTLGGVGGGYLLSLRKKKDG